MGPPTNPVRFTTKKDLEAERAAVQDALKDICVVRHSYLASEDALVQSCLDNVAECDLYILVLGLRYGYVPQGSSPTLTSSPSPSSSTGTRRVALPGWCS
jgi:hypothetical protein